MRSRKRGEVSDARREEREREEAGTKERESESVAVFLRNVI